MSYLAMPWSGVGVLDSQPPVAPAAVDTAIRVSTALAVLTVAGIAAYMSYWHAYAVVCAHGESGITARLEPATIDDLVYASSIVTLYAARHRLPVPGLARWLLGLGIAATLAANVAQGWPHGLVGATVAAWPAVSLVGSYELLVWIIRTAAADGSARVQSRTNPALSRGTPLNGTTCLRRSAWWLLAMLVRDCRILHSEGTRRADQPRKSRTTCTRMWTSSLLHQAARPH